MFCNLDVHLEIWRTTHRIVTQVNGLKAGQSLGHGQTIYMPGPPGKVWESALICRMLKGEQIQHDTRVPASLRVLCLVLTDMRQAAFCGILWPQPLACMDSRPLGHACLHGLQVGLCFLRSRSRPLRSEDPNMAEDQHPCRDVKDGSLQLYDSKRLPDHRQI